MKILIKNGQIVDPAAGVQKELDLLIEDGKISEIGRSLKASGAKEIDAKGKLVLPGLIDMHAHLREPGREDKETILTGSRAAAKGGFTTVCCMPNTSPCIDSQGVARFIISEAERAGLIDVRPVGAITKERNGEELSEMADLKRAGCVAVSDDGNPVPKADMMRRALEYASMMGFVVISHCEDKDLSGIGVMNEGFISTILGLRPIPRHAESFMVERDIRLAELTGAKLHIAHVSTKESVELIREAKARGAAVTAETCPHYFTLTDEAVKSFDTNLKVNPPLRTAADVEAIKEGLRDGTIDVIATDHAPHTENEKDVEFDYAPFGMIGFETALGLVASELVEKKVLDWKGVAEKMAVNPSKILGLGKGTLAQGAAADITIIDPNKEWQLKREDILSKSHNTPFIGRKMTGLVEYTIASGKIIYTS
ncbi:MAG: dihydroorotase [Candidatus Omnitrophica bacterium]|nr:dihydroorotase [Candidatus Omnitrophota bacterium]